MLIKYVTGKYLPLAVMLRSMIPCYVALAKHGNFAELKKGDNGTYL